MVIDVAVMFALGAAFSYAVADMAMRYGIQHTTPFVGSTIGRTFSVTTLGVLILLSGATFPAWARIIFGCSWPGCSIRGFSPFVSCSG